MPEKAKDEICAAYRQLQAEYGDDISVAVRSSATAEDLPNASFAVCRILITNVVHYPHPHLHLQLCVLIFKMCTNDRDNMIRT